MTFIFAYRHVGNTIYSVVGAVFEIFMLQAVDHHFQQILQICLHVCGITINLPADVWARLPLCRSHYVAPLFGHVSFGHMQIYIGSRALTSDKGRKLTAATLSISNPPTKPTPLPWRVGYPKLGGGGLRQSSTHGQSIIHFGQMSHAVAHVAVFIRTDSWSYGFSLQTGENENGKCARIRATDPECFFEKRTQNQAAGHVPFDTYAWAPLHMDFTTCSWVLLRRLGFKSQLDRISCLKVVRTREEVIERALQWDGKPYSLFSDNCQAFVEDIIMFATGLVA